MTVSKIPLVAVIGHPISHSKSPRLHGNWLKKLGLQGHYIPVDVEPADFGYILKAMPKMGFVGANVTVPHKHLALMHADHVSDRAALIGAANTLSFSEDGKIYADNTDGYGFIENIKDYCKKFFKDRFATAGIAIFVMSLILESPPSVL